MARLVHILAFAATPSAAGPTSHAGDRSVGMFLLALWSASMVVLTWDMTASATGGCPVDTTCLATGFDGIHATMQAILFLLALGTGATGAKIWLGSPARAT
ncbi:MAG TPA: hypothetical protein VM286_08515 [Candidatus Thermoplasmatota archaeon]|nr:hypothetical protein [Candidatus Thermoplasmatota archaeon]